MDEDEEGGGRWRRKRRPMRLREYADLVHLVHGDAHLVHLVRLVRLVHLVHLVHMEDAHGGRRRAFAEAAADRTICAKMLRCARVPPPRAVASSCLPPPFAICRGVQRVCVGGVWKLPRAFASAAGPVAAAAVRRDDDAATAHANAAVRVGLLPSFSPPFSRLRQRGHALHRRRRLCASRSARVQTSASRWRRRTRPPPVGTTHRRRARASARHGRPSPLPSRRPGSSVAVLLLLRAPLRVRRRLWARPRSPPDTIALATAPPRGRRAREGARALVSPAPPLHRRSWPPPAPPPPPPHRPPPPAHLLERPCTRDRVLNWSLIGRHRVTRFLITSGRLRHHARRRAVQLSALAPAVLSWGRAGTHTPSVRLCVAHPSCLFPWLRTLVCRSSRR